MTSYYTYNNQTVDFQLTYKKRKTLGIYIDVYGNIELRVPKATEDQQIIDLLESKWSWIVRKQGEMKERTKGFKEKTYEDGEEFLFLGNHYPIEVEEDPKAKHATITFDQSTLKIVVPVRDEAMLKKLMTKFYKQQCKKLVESRIREYQSNFKVKPKSIKINGNKKNWGTCNSLRDLTFNWKLAMAPLKVIDYVVIHEMCHMIHMNHDRSFWRLVGKYMPDYEAQQNWLKETHWQMVV